jgi:2-polyprenyl-3-methyl-5-hydroxy-6-metoxy-1,4-benzoquinol methylase
MLTLSEAQDLVERLAPTDYYREHYRGFEADYLQDVAELVDGRRPGLPVLEVGPGWGTLAVWMVSRGYDVTVLDYLPLGTFMAQPLLDETGIRYVQGSIDHDAAPGGLIPGYELVVMTQVIPHLKWSPVDALSNVANVMHPEGTLVTSALDAELYPHIQPAHRHWSEVPRWTPEARPAEQLEICMYTQEALGDLLSGAFESVRVWRPAGSTTLLATCKWPKGGD